MSLLCETHRLCLNICNDVRVKKVNCRRQRQQKKVFEGVSVSF